MIKVKIDEAYREIIKEVSEWMVDEYTYYRKFKLIVFIQQKCLTTES